MLHILLLILKIIGITILVLLGIVILLLCTVLFVPIRYEMKSNTPDGIGKLFVEAKISWILRLISFRSTYKDKKVDWNIRIFGVKLRFSKKKKATKQVEETTEKKQDIKKQEKNTEEKKEEKKSWFKRTIEKIKKIWSIKEKITDFIDNKTHKAAFKRLKKELGILAKRYKPRKIKGYVRFGCEDPYQTGKILAILSVFYPFYCENVQIYPDFENAVLEGNLDIKGHIRIIWLVVMIFHLIFDKRVRKTIEDGRKLNLFE